MSYWSWKDTQNNEGDKMESESICCSLETAKLLGKAGWDKETVFVWLFQCNQTYRLWPVDHIGYRLDDMTDYYYAPTSSEIEFPIDTSLRISNKDVTCNVHYDLEGSGRVELADTEVEAKAKMWLYLKEMARF